jgi:hypothetical protein
LFPSVGISDHQKDIVVAAADMEVDALQEAVMEAPVVLDDVTIVSMGASTRTASAVDAARVASTTNN